MCVHVCMDSLRWLRAIDRSEASADRTFSRLGPNTYEEKKETPLEKRRACNAVAAVTGLAVSGTCFCYVSVNELETLYLTVSVTPRHCFYHM